MATTTMTPLEIIDALTPAEKRQALAALRQAEQSPCQQRGHKYKPVATVERWFLPPQTKLVCTACGASIQR